MRRMVALGVLAASAIGLDRADACAFPPAVELVDWMPADGADNVPLNARVIAWYQLEAEPELIDDLVLRPVGGSPVPASVEVIRVGYRASVVLTPASNLAPNTEYELVHHWPETCWSLRCTPGPATVFSGFVTGDWTKDDVPVFGGATGWTELVHPEDDSGCCEPGSQIATVSLEHEAVPDDHIATLYLKDGSSLVQVAGPDRLPFVDTAKNMCNGASCYAVYVLPNFFWGGTYVLRIVDIAGHEDENTAEVSLIPQCEDRLGTDAGPGVIDGGAPTGADAGVLDVDASPMAFGDAAGGCGCNASDRRGGSGGAGLLLGVVVMALRNRQVFGGTRFLG